MIKETLSWLKGAVVAAVVLGGGQAALASSPPPWNFWFMSDIYSEFVAADPARALWESKRTYQELQDPEGAYRIVTDLGYPQDDEEIMFWRAWYASKAGLVDEAEGIYRELIERDSSLVAWHYNALGHLLAAHRYSRLDEAAELLELALEIEPRKPEIIHSYGMVFEARGYLEIARMHYEEAAALLKNEKYRYSRLNPEWQSDTYFSNQDHTDRTNEQLAEIIFDYGRILVAMGNEYGSFNKDEFDLLMKRVKGEEGEIPHLSAPLIVFREACINDFDYEKVSFTSAMIDALGKEDVKVESALALMLHRVEDEAGARLRLERAEKLIDENSSTADLAAYMLAVSEVGETQETEGKLRFLVDREPDNPWHYNNLGYVLADSGRQTGEAVELLEKALELAPDRPEIVSSYAWALHNNGQSVEAQAMSEKASGHHPQMDVYRDASTQAEYGEILRSLGHEEWMGRASFYAGWRNGGCHHGKVFEILDKNDIL